MFLLIVYGTLAIVVSFLCSVLEASLLSLPRSQVEAMVEHGSPTGLKLKQMKENIDRPLAAILTLNTIAHTVGAAGVGAQAAVVFGNAAIGIASAVMTLAILVFSEIIPKTLGAVHAKKLAGFTTHAIRIMILVCYPLIIILEQINRIIGYQRHRDRITRSEVLATIRMGWKGGSLAAREHHLVSNVLALNNISLSQVLTPRTVVFALPQELTVKEAVDQHYPIRFARIPLYGESTDYITGYVPRFEIHRALVEGKEDMLLKDILSPIVTFPELASVSSVLEQMLKDNLHIALIVNEFGGFSGIVTLEDLLETLLGEEIVDETDVVIDMRELARKKAKRLGQRGKIKKKEEG